MARTGDWFPLGNPYLARSDSPEVRPDRPIAQGDVFVDVPVALYRKYPPSREGQHPTEAKQTTVVLYGHPCTSRAGDALERVQNVAVVGKASRLLGGSRWESPYPGRYRLFPLPALVAGEDHVADLGQLAVTRAEYLEGSRVACLSFEALAAFQGRCVRAVSRVDLSIEENERRCTPLWTELGLWERWKTARGTVQGFHAWLDHSLSSREGTTRRQALMGAPEEVAADLDAELRGEVT